jgi:hypothetical protein
MFITLTLICVYSTVLTNDYTVYGLSSQEVNINVTPDTPLDIVLTVGDTDTTLTNFQNELTNKLLAKGVPSDLINFQGIETSVTSTETSDAEAIFNEWINYKAQYSTPAWDFVDKEIVNSNNTNWSGYFDSEFNSDSFTVELDMRATGNDNDDIGITFGMTGFPLPIENSINKEVNLSGEYNGYVFIFRGGSSTFPSSQIVMNYGANHPSGLYKFNDGDGYLYPLCGTDQYFTPGQNLNYKFKLEVDSNKIKIYKANSEGGYTSDPIIDYTINENDSTLKGGWGFFSHSQTAAFSSINMVSSSSKKFLEVIRNPNWSAESSRFIINAHDGIVDEFSNDIVLGEILSRMGNEDISYIGWGKQSDDGETFIAKNNNNGIYINKASEPITNYDQQVQSIADYIYNEYATRLASEDEYYLYGNPVSLDVTPLDYQSDTIDADYPQGKWLIKYDDLNYDNPTGTVPFDNVRFDNLDVSITETGKYEIYYKGDPDTDDPIKTFYIHRAPIADFSLSVDASYNASVTDNSYDPDFQTAQQKGIETISWSYKEVSSSNWIDVKPTVFEADKNYVVKQIVTDQYNEVSTPFYNYVSTQTSEVVDAVADFTVTPKDILKYSDDKTLTYNDCSYDPQGSTITERLWKVFFDGNEIYSSSTALTDFSTKDIGIYKITLSVKKGELWSEPISRFVNVLDDTTAPRVTPSIPADTYYENKTINVEFSDEENGSGFGYRYAVLSPNSETPTNWGDKGINTNYSIGIHSVGTYYFHYKVVDYAGNEAIGYFGPYIFVDDEAPSDPIVTNSIDYVNDTWANEEFTVEFGNSTDNMTPSESLTYSYLIGETEHQYTPGDMIIIESNSKKTINFKVCDINGNCNTNIKKIYKADTTKPANPIVNMTSNGSNYISDTWTKKSVYITLSGYSDNLTVTPIYQYQIGDGEWQDYNGTNIKLEESNIYDLNIVSVDAAGNRSDVVSKKVKIDTVAPNSVEVVTTEDYIFGEWTNEVIHVSFGNSSDNLTADDNLVYTYSEDGIDYIDATSFFLLEGEHNISFKVVDEAGQSTIIEKMFKIDLTLPTKPDVTMTSNEATYNTNDWTNHLVNIKVSSGTDNLSGVSKYRYRIKKDFGELGTWLDYSEFNIAEDGIYTIDFKTIDNAGNESAITSKIVKLDTKNPIEANVEASVTTPLGNEVYVFGDWSQLAIDVEFGGSTDNITGNITENEIVYSYSFDGLNYTEGKSFKLIEDKEYAIYFKATDESGLYSIITKEFKIDVTKPLKPEIIMSANEVTYVSDTWTSYSVGIEIANSVDNLSKVAKYQYKVDDGEWIDGSTKEFSLSGNHTIYYRSVDNAGNISESGSKIIKTDMEEPVSFEINSSSTVIGSIDVEASTTDELSELASLGYRVFDGEEWSAWKESVDETLSGYSRGEVVTIIVEARDVAGNVYSSSKEVTTLLNTNPIAIEDSISIAEDSGTVKIDVLKNDIDLDMETALGDTLTIKSITGLSNSSAGTISLSNNVILFTPSSNYNGVITMNYTVEDELNAQDSDKITITVTSVNDKPKISDEFVSTNEEQSIIIDVLKNDVDIDSVLVVKSFTKPLHGFVTQTSSGLKYTPEKDFYGNDSFDYVVSDGSNYENGKVSIKINNINDHPVLKVDSSSTLLNQSVEVDVLANDYDVENINLKIASLIQPSNGSAIILDNKIVYTPNLGFIGKDEVKYIVNDYGVFTSSLTIEVKYPEFYFDKKTALISFVQNSIEDGNDDKPLLGISLISKPQKGGFDTLGSDIYYTPREGMSGIDTFMIKKSDIEYEVIANIDESGESIIIGFGIPLSSEIFSGEKNIEILIDLTEYITDNKDINNIEIIGSPVNGNVKIDGNTLIYTPNQDFVGEDGMVLSVFINNESTPYAIDLQVDDVDLTADDVDSVSWMNTLGYFILIVLLIINYFKNKIFYNLKKSRIVLYVIIGIIAAVLCYLLASSIGNLWANIIFAVYVLINYLISYFASQKKI